MTYIIKDFSWNTAGTNIILKNITKKDSEIIKDFFDINDEDRLDNGDYPIYGEDIENVFLLEEDFIETKQNSLKDIIEKLNEKIYTGTFYYYSRTKGKLIVINDLYNFEDYPFITELFSNNIINSQDFVNKEFYLSPKIFGVLSQMYNEYEKGNGNYTSQNILNYLRELFTLFIIAEKTEIKNDDNSGIIFEFSLSNDLYGNVIRKIKWGEWDELANNNLYSLYEWITDDLVDGLINKENEYNLKQAKLRLNVVRNYLKSKKDFLVNENSIAELNTILNRIHRNETEEYFKQQNKLKDEMIELTKDEMTSKKGITNRLLGLITTISVGIYTQFFEVDIKSISNLFDANFKISLIFLFSFIAILFFAFTLYLEIDERNKYYNKLKEVYIEDLGYSKKDFEDKLPKPEIWNDYKVYWHILLIAGFIALLGIVFFSNVGRYKNFWCLITFIYIISSFIISNFFVEKDDNTN